MQSLDHAACTRALEAADPRFDGVFFVGVTSTGIYCRPICPARATLRRNRRFFASAAAAERAGFRPCLRCRPELAPGLARVDAVPRLAQTAATRITGGAMNEGGVEAVASELGVSARQLRRAMQLEFGVSPVELAQTQRLLLAKQLLTDTRLPVTQVAYASGFQSVRRFNTLFRSRYRLNPQGLRKRAAPGGGASRGETVQLTLSYRPPLDWKAMLAFLGARATPGVEVVDGDSYARTVRCGRHAGAIRVSPLAEALRLEVSASLLPVLMQVCAAVRRLFDLDAEPRTIEAHLVAGGLRASRRMRRGLRVPGAIDGFELATRAILGQQVSVAGATTLMARLTSAFGERLESDHPALTRLAITAERLSGALVSDIRAIGLPASRARTVLLLARVVADGPVRLDPGADVGTVTRQLLQIPGIGPWTAEYIAMRALHWPDAFPASDLVLRRRAGDLTPREMLDAAERWRPWRAYAAMHLWMGPS